MKTHFKDIGEILFYIGLAAFVYFKPKYDIWRKRNKVNLSQSITVIQEIDKQCVYLLGLLEAKRISVWQFGNGQESFMGFSFKYSSMIGEAVRPDQAFLRNESQQIPIYDYVPILNLMKEQEVVSYHIEWAKGKNLFHILTSLGIEKSYECKLNSERLEDGMLSIAFDEDKELNEHEIEEVKRISYNIYKLLKKK